MTTRRLVFWGSFIIVLGLIIWGLIVAMQKPVGDLRLGTAPDVRADDNIIGNVSAPVTITEYSDFQCPACAQYHPVLKRLLAEASSTVRLVYRHFPLDNRLPNGEIQHPNAVPAARAAEAAAKQGKFAEMYDLLFENQLDWSLLKDPRPAFDTYAGMLGLDMTVFRADYDSDLIRDKVTGHKSEGIRLGLSYTPTFFVNGNPINNPQSYEEFVSIVQNASLPVEP